MSMLQALVDGVSAEDQIRQLAERLSLIHGTVSIRNESSGTHLTMACPLCLADDGRKELKSKHLQINADKYLGLGKYKQRYLPQTRDNSSLKKGYAQCMKTHGAMSMKQIMGWPPLDERGIENFSPIRVIDGGTSRYLVPDEHGRMVPDHPGKTTSLTSLPKGHPALVYLEQRDYDPSLLVQQFRAAWCYEEAKEGTEFNRWYRKHGWGWKSTPQGRIIFYSDVAGMQACWQARYLSIQHEGMELLWHPYHEGWESRPPWPEKEGPVKYLTASSSFRNTQLCGYDSALLQRQARGESSSNALCVLTEGPLDAARFPDRGLAILGKSMSSEQALLVALNYKRAVLAFDADPAGAQACKTTAERLHERGVRTINFFSEEEQKSDEKIDVGILGYATCAERLKELMSKLD